MRQHLDPPLDVRATGPFDQPEGEPARREAAEAGGGEGAVAQHIDDRAGPFEGRCLEIHAATHIAQRGIAIGLKRPSHGLAKDMGQRPHLRHEGEPPAPDLADGTAAQQHALRRCRPIHPPDLDRRIVPPAVEDVGLGDPVRRQHTLRILRIDGKVGAGSHL